MQVWEQALIKNINLRCHSISGRKINKQKHLFAVQQNIQCVDVVEVVAVIVGAVEVVAVIVDVVEVVAVIVDVVEVVVAVVDAGAAPNSNTRCPALHSRASLENFTS